MTMPAPFSPSWLEGNELDALQLNQFVAWALSGPRGYLGDAADGTTRTLTTGGTTYTAFAAGSVTFTISPGETRRVRIYVQTRFVPNTASTDGRYAIWASYNTGSSIGTPTLLNSSEAAYVNNEAVGGSGQTYASSQNTEGTVRLTAGTYTAYGAVQRTNGNTADTADMWYCAVYDVGAG